MDNKKFKVGGQEIRIINVDNLDGKLGECCLAAGWVKIADKFKGESKLNTLYHEMTHAILDTMGRDDLSADEVFVSSFASFLTEALTTLNE